MPLTLRLDDPYAAGGGATAELTLDRRGAIMGRSPTVDWTLPDPEKIVSSRHCEIDYRGGAYLLVDTSTNGTLVNDRPMAGPHVLANGDRIGIGRYRIAVELDAPVAAAPAPAAQAGWPGGWEERAAPAAAEANGWSSAAPPASEISGRGVLSGQWSAPRVSEQPPPVLGGWAPAPAPVPAPGWGPSPAEAVAAAPSAPVPDPWSAWAPPASPAAPASPWSSAAAPPTPPAADDIWGRLEQGHVVDWARGGFGAPTPSPPEPPRALGLPAAPEPPSFPAAPPPSFAQPAPEPTLPPQPAPPAPAGPLDRFAQRFAEAAGLPRADLPSDEALADAAGRLLRRLVGGLTLLVEARARAKAQMGAQRTALEFDGNNPLKFARTPEQALAQLLRPPERGFMPAERAVEDAYVDLQAHQVATIKAMQGALRTTLDRFSPGAIRGRAEKRGLLARILPGARDAALWAAYEREFSGVAQGSDEAFMDVFAKEFRRAYEEAARRPGG